MGSQKQEEISRAAKERRERILQYITANPPRPLAAIKIAEGMADRSLRLVIKELEQEHGIEYLGKHSRRGKNTDIPGLTNATTRFRQKLGDQLYLLRERGNDSNQYIRNAIAPQVGLNAQQQIRAEQKPFNHDWTLSQIERLAVQHGRDPVEFMLWCLTS